MTHLKKLSNGPFNGFDVNKKKLCKFFRTILFFLISCTSLTINSFAGEVSITETTFDRVPAKISQTGLSRGTVNRHYKYKDSFEFQITSGLHLYLEVTNNSDNEFIGSVSYDYLIDPNGEKYDWKTGGIDPINLGPGEKKNYVIGVRPTIFLASNISPGTWTFSVDLKQGTNIFNKEVIESKEMAFEVISDSVDTSTGPFSGNIVPITYKSETTMLWLQSLTLWSEILKFSPIGAVIDIVSEFFGPYQDALEDLDKLNNEIISAATVSVREGPLEIDKRTIIVKWNNYTDSVMPSYFDRCLLGVKIPSYVEILEAKKAMIATDGKGNTVLLWDFLRPDKRITPNYGETIEFVIRETSSKITIEATATLMMGPYRYHHNWPSEIIDISMLPWIIDYELWNINPEETYWYVLSGDTYPKKVSGDGAPYPPKNLSIVSADE